MNLIIKNTSAWAPLAMSFAAILLVVGYLAIFGIVQSQAAKTDEGTAARIFQLLLAGQVPIIGFFAFKWLPKMPKQALIILALQIAGVLIAFALVFFLEM